MEDRGRRKGLDKHAWVQKVSRPTRHHEELSRAGEDTTSAARDTAKVERDRRDDCAGRGGAEAGRSAGRTVRATAAAEGVPTSTAYRWLVGKAGSDATQESKLASPARMDWKRCIGS